MNDFVTTAWLDEHRHDSNVRIVDIRGRVLPPDQPLPHYYSHHADYITSHLPGAVFIDWVVDIVEPGSAAHDVANPERYAALMSQLGVGDDTLVIAYDDAGGMFAARLWWTLHYYGHTQVAVLDGGWQKWVAENRPTTDVIPTFAPAVFTPRIQAELRRTADDVAQRAATTSLIDVRTPEEFTGKSSRAQRNGHIPGALNIPRSKFLNPDGTLQAPEQLRLTFEAAGIALDVPEVITYCNGGVSASYGMLALRAAGVQNIAVYDGSWKDWGNDFSRPIE